MGLVKIKKTVYTNYKGKQKKYTYYELHKTFRDPNNKAKVISKYLAYLGKDPHGFKAKERIERFKQEAQGHYSAERLAKKVEKEMEKESQKE